MNIAIDAYHAMTPHGGSARYVRGLVPALAAAAPADQFVMFSNQYRDRRPPWNPGLPNVGSYRVPWPRRLVQSAWDHLNWPPVESFLGPIDVFHGTHLVLPAVRRARTVLTVNDLTYLRHPEYFSDPALNERGYRVELPRSLARADAVIAISAHTKRDLVELLGYPESRVRVIHFGVEPEFFLEADDPHVAAARRRYHLDGPYLVCLVGTPEPRKNLARTLAAARRAAPDLPLAIIGPLEPIRTLLNGDAQDARLLGPVPDHDLPAVLHAAELALYPSLYEGFGLPALEAMAAGVPLITSNRSALPEVVGKAAVLVDPESVDDIAQAIRDLLQDAGRRKSLIDAGRTRAKELTWERAAQHVLRLYRELA